jgi:hypothetical protein
MLKREVGVKAEIHPPKTHNKTKSREVGAPHKIYMCCNPSDQHRIPPVFPFVDDDWTAIMANSTARDVMRIRGQEVLNFALFFFVDGLEMSTGFLHVSL